MSKVGIIANPASGKDIRRLVSHATVVSNNEKTDIIKRVILGLDSTGVEEVLIMPDYYGMGIRAKEALNHHSVSCRINVMEFEIQGNQEDSTVAARMMQQENVDCIITLGGDGTNRVVSKGCGRIRDQQCIPVDDGRDNGRNCCRTSGPKDRESGRSFRHHEKDKIMRLGTGAGYRPH
ncbi:MAG: NAD(+)/NADH kinase [Deltaproteobacteria bacterium]|nr:NAD(+)/NADH kinase [Deltaproteobacteria bacterium]